MADYETLRPQTPRRTWTSDRPACHFFRPFAERPPTSVAPGLGQSTAGPTWRRRSTVTRIFSAMPRPIPNRIGPAAIRAAPYRAPEARITVILVPISRPILTRRAWNSRPPPRAAILADCPGRSRLNGLRRCEIISPFSFRVWKSFFRPGSCRRPRRTRPASPAACRTPETHPARCRRQPANAR